MAEILEHCPVATYRLQLRNGMTFAAAARLAPYFARLGVSHLYLSPIFKATPGSTHGYDAVDFAQIEPELGGRAGFVALADALRANGIGIVLDIVPNHMGAHPDNPWWRSVLEWGSRSPFAGHFDVNWSAPKLIVPRLGGHYGDVVRARGFQVGVHAGAGELFLAYGEMRLPLNPPSYTGILAGAGEPFGTIALRFATASRSGAEELKKELAQLLADPDAAQRLDRAIAGVNGYWKLLHEVHEQQIWRLAHWRTAREDLTYRRFFEISELVGTKVEQPNVFEDVHRVVLDLVEAGLVDGLRIDHIDGLADPLGYLNRLKASIRRRGIYIVAEKIFGAGEEQRPDWPLAGTTGYEFIAVLAGLLVDDSNGEALTGAYERFLGEKRDVSAETLAVKRRTITRNLAGELDNLADLASNLAAGDIATRDLGRDTIRRGIVELAAAMPVYRTYVDASGPSADDEAVLARAADAAKQTREVEDETTFNFLVSLFRLDLADAHRRAAALQFATRFQQTTGPLTAKALEDTLFYRYNRLIAVNEVGGEVDPLGAPIERFHEALAARPRWPMAMSATATHDTKRGEDARARIYSISEDPEAWATAAERWSALNVPLNTNAAGERALSRDFEWMFYQALLGAWPAALASDDKNALLDLAGRLREFMIKSAREGKLYTTWTQPDETYESGLTSFVDSVLDPVRSAEFLADFRRSVRPFIRAGVANSVAQLCIKVFAPGVPDIYQGTEAWDLSLVDPDNRRPIDFENAPATDSPDARALLYGWASGGIKRHVLGKCLELRKTLGHGLLTATYEPLAVSGPLARHLVCFARRSEARTVIVLATRFSMQLLENEAPRIDPERWSDTRVVLGEGPLLEFVDVLTGRTIRTPDGRLDVGTVLADLPAAVLLQTIGGDLHAEGSRRI